MSWAATWLGAFGALAAQAAGCGEAFSDGEGGVPPATTTTGSSTSTGGTGGTGGGAGADGGGAASCVAFSDACSQCSFAVCAETYCGCQANPVCTLLANCVGNCSAEPACEQQCRTSYPDGISEAALAMDCAATECEAHCPGLTTIPPCNECLFGLCSTSMNSCLAETECTALLYCGLECLGDGACRNGCFTQHPNASNLGEAVWDCLLAQCTDACPWALG